MTWSSAEAAAKPEADVGPALQQDLQQLIHWPWLQVAHPSQASHSVPISAVQTVLHVQLMPGVASTYPQWQTGCPQHHQSWTHVRRMLRRCMGGAPSPLSASRSAPPTACSRLATTVQTAFSRRCMSMRTVRG